MIRRVRALVIGGCSASRSTAARNAQASKVDGQVAADGSKVMLTVVDDGVGIPTGGRRSGLADLAERAEQFDGRFGAVPGVDGAAANVWSVPLERAPSLTDLPDQAEGAAGALGDKADSAGLGPRGLRTGSCAPCRHASVH